MISLLACALYAKRKYHTDTEKQHSPIVMLTSTISIAGSIHREVSLVNECCTLFIKLHLTTLDERSKVGRKREPATGSEHFAGGHENRDPSVTV